MATRSFAATAEPPTVEKAPAVVDRTETAVVPASHWGGGQVEGEVDAGDIRLPRINLVQKSGELGDLFSPGSFVFNREIQLSDGKEPMELVALRIRKQYQEALEYDPDGPSPKVFNTSAEVREAGGHFNYDAKDEGGYYKEIAHILCLIEAPKNASEEQRDFFIYEHDGRNYALAMWTVTGGAYTAVAKTLFTAAAGHLRAGLHLGKWTIVSTKKSNGSCSWYVPAIRAAGKTTPEFQEFAASLLN